MKVTLESTTQIVDLEPDSRFDGAGLILWVLTAWFAAFCIAAWALFRHFA